MQTASREYEAAIVSGHRKIVPMAIIDLIGPDVAYESMDTSRQNVYSKEEQLYDRKFKAADKFATLEEDRFLLDGSFVLYPDAPKAVTGEHGYLGEQISDGEGSFAKAEYIRLNVANVDLLQAASVHFTGAEWDGVAADMVLEVYSGGRVAYRGSVTGNTKCRVDFEEFTVEQADAVKLTVTKWSRPNRRARMIEFVLGFYDEWHGDMIYDVDVLQETSFDGTAAPYGTCTLEIYNRDKMFNPFNKNGLFRSIEARQGVPVLYGISRDAAETEYLPLGVYYQQSGGWETDAYGLTITFKLVDIVGLIARRNFIVPDPLPATLDGWIAAVVSHLGLNFAKRYIVDADVSAVPLTAEPDKLENMTCDQILRFACMASGTFFRADNATGFLRVQPVREDAAGITITLDNMHSYPKNSAGESIAQIVFRLADQDNTEYMVKGPQETTGKSLNISNPFIHTAVEAEAAAAYILQFSGLTEFTVQGRGDMRSELGDIDTAETGFGGSARGRRYKQQFKFVNGVLKTAPSYVISADQISG